MGEEEERREDGTERREDGTREKRRKEKKRV